MNILKMKYFIDVADNLSFTKAAQQNYVSQTAVSQQIAAIERELGVQLFQRDKGKVALTAAGEAFYQDCARILRQYDQAVSRVQNLQSEHGGSVTLGFLTACKMGYLYDVVKKFHEKFPHTDIKLRQSSFESMRRELNAGEMDVALSSACNLQDVEHIAIEEMTRRKMGLLVSRDNPLSRFDEITTEQAAAQDIVMISPKFAGRVYDHMLAQRRKEGYEPHIVETADSSEILVMLVELNRGCVFLPEKTAIYNRSLCKMLHIKNNEDYFDLSLAWRLDQPSKALTHFVHCLREFFRTEYPRWEDENR